MSQNFKCFEYGFSPISKDQHNDSEVISVTPKTVQPTLDNINTFLVTSVQYDASTKRWAGPPEGVGNNICSPFTSILDAVLEYFELPNAYIPTELGHAQLETAYRTKIFLPSDPQNMEGDEESVLDYATLYARDTLRQQSNRFFVSCMFVTDADLNATWFIFARDGMHHTANINVHKDAINFIQIALGVSSEDNRLPGCDSSLYWQADIGSPFYPPKATHSDDPLTTRNRGIHCWDATIVPGYVSSLKVMNEVWRPLCKDSAIAMDVDVKADVGPMAICQNLQDFHLESKAKLGESAEGSDAMEIKDSSQGSAMHPPSLKRVSEEHDPHRAKKHKSI